MKKPIIEWLYELPSGYKERALYNHRLHPQPVFVGGQASSLASAISLAQIWAHTPEGAVWWSDVQAAIVNKYELPPLPDDGRFTISSTPPSGGVDTQQTTQTPMHKYSAVPVATPTLVFGTDVTDLGANACIETIKSNNAQIKSLRETGITSPYITQQIAGLEAANAALVAQLDTFAAPVAAPVAG